MAWSELSLLWEGTIEKSGSPWNVDGGEIYFQRSSMLINSSSSYHLALPDCSDIYRSRHTSLDLMSFWAVEPYSWGWRRLTCTMRELSRALLPSAQSESAPPLPLRARWSRLGCRRLERPRLHDEVSFDATSSGSQSQEQTVKIIEGLKNSPTSAPINSMPSRPSRIVRSSLVVQPPTSAVPVAGA